MPTARLFVVCMDTKCRDNLKELNRPGLIPIPLEELENESLRHVKAERTRAEYCWTLTPFVCKHILENHPDCQRVTYLDADLVFFHSPDQLLAEITSSNADVLITEHAYDPQYQYLENLAGKFCVQFLTFCNTTTAKSIVEDWAEKCLAECTSKVDPHRKGFGDQRYLEDWPERFGTAVHVLTNKPQALAPWNVDYYQGAAKQPYFPVFFHFHAFRLLGPTYVRLSGTYRIRRAKHIYERYLGILQGEITSMLQHGIPIPYLPLHTERFWFLRTAKRLLFQNLVIRPHRLRLKAAPEHIQEGAD